jgi:hypothetical protein
VRDWLWAERREKLQVRPGSWCKDRAIS